MKKKNTYTIFWSMVTFFSFLLAFSIAIHIGTPFLALIILPIIFAISIYSGYRRRKRLKASGITYAAEEIIVTPTYSGKSKRHMRLKVHSRFRHSNGDVFTTDSWHIFGHKPGTKNPLDIGPERWEGFDYSAMAYVNPNDPKDYVVKLTIDCKQ